MKVSVSGTGDTRCFTRNQNKDAVRTFTLYMRYPESEYPRIAIAEKLDEKGNAMIAELQKVFVERYFDGDAVSIHA